MESHTKTVILGAVAGDNHHTGKTTAGMVLERAGWKAADVGVDATTEGLLAAFAGHPVAVPVRRSPQASEGHERAPREE